MTMRPRSGGPPSLLLLLLLAAPVLLLSTATSLVAAKQTTAASTSTGRLSPLHGFAAGMTAPAHVTQQDEAGKRHAHTFRHEWDDGTHVALSYDVEFDDVPIVHLDHEDHRVHRVTCMDNRRLYVEHSIDDDARARAVFAVDARVSGGTTYSCDPALDRHRRRDEREAARARGGSAAGASGFGMGHDADVDDADGHDEPILRVVTRVEHLPPRDDNDDNNNDDDGNGDRRRRRGVILHTRAAHHTEFFKNAKWKLSMSRFPQRSIRVHDYSHDGVPGRPHVRGDDDYSGGSGGANVRVEVDDDREDVDDATRAAFARMDASTPAATFGDGVDDDYDNDGRHRHSPYTRRVVSMLQHDEEQARRGAYDTRPVNHRLHHSYDDDDDEAAVHHNAPSTQPMPAESASPPRAAYRSRKHIDVAALREDDPSSSLADGYGDSDEEDDPFDEEDVDDDDAPSSLSRHASPQFFRRIKKGAGRLGRRAKKSFKRAARFPKKATKAVVKKAVKRGKKTYKSVKKAVKAGKKVVKKATKVVKKVKKIADNKWVKKGIDLVQKIPAVKEVVDKVKTVVATATKIVKAGVRVFNIVKGLIKGELSEKETLFTHNLGWNYGGNEQAARAIPLAIGITCHKCFFDFENSIEMELEIASYKLALMRITHSGIVRASVGVHIPGPGAPPSFNWRKKIANLFSKTFFFTIAAVPVWFKIEVPVYIGFDFEVDVSDETKAEINLKGTVVHGVEVRHGRFNTINTRSYSRTGTMDDVLNKIKGFTARFYLDFVPTLTLQSLIIVPVSIKPYIQLTIDAIRGSDPRDRIAASTCANKELQPQSIAVAAALTLGIDINISLTLQLKILSQTIFTKSWPAVFVYKFARQVVGGCFLFPLDVIVRKVKEVGRRVQDKIGTGVENIKRRAGETAVQLRRRREQARRDRELAKQRQDAIRQQQQRLNAKGLEPINPRAPMFETCGSSFRAEQCVAAGQLLNTLALQRRCEGTDGCTVRQCCVAQPTCESHTCQSGERVKNPADVVCAAATGCYEIECCVPRQSGCSLSGPYAFLSAAQMTESASARAANVGQLRRYQCDVSSVPDQRRVAVAYSVTAVNEQDTFTARMTKGAQCRRALDDYDVKTTDSPAVSCASPPGTSCVRSVPRNLAGSLQTFDQATDDNLVCLVVVCTNVDRPCVLSVSVSYTMTPAVADTRRLLQATETPEQPPASVAATEPVTAPVTTPAPVAAANTVTGKFNAQDDRFAASWVIDTVAKTMTVTMTSRTTGWLAIGFSKVFQAHVMTDIYMASVDPKTGDVLKTQDSYSTSYAMPERDTQESAMTDVTGKHIDGLTTVTFTRKLVSEHNADINLEEQRKREAQIAAGDDTHGIDNTVSPLDAIVARHGTPREDLDIVADREYFVQWARGPSTNLARMHVDSGDRGSGFAVLYDTNTGAQRGVLTEGAPAPVRCRVSIKWAPCSVTCGGGTQTGTVTFTEGTRELCADSYPATAPQRPCNVHTPCAQRGWLQPARVTVWRLQPNVETDEDVCAEVAHSAVLPVCSPTGANVHQKLRHGGGVEDHQAGTEGTFSKWVCYNGLLMQHHGCTSGCATCNGELAQATLGSDDELDNDSFDTVFAVQENVCYADDNNALQYACTGVAKQTSAVVNMGTKLELSLYSVDPGSVSEGDQYSGFVDFDVLRPRPRAPQPEDAEDDADVDCRDTAEGCFTRDPDAVAVAATPAQRARWERRVDAAFARCRDRRYNPFLEIDTRYVKRMGITAPGEAAAPIRGTGDSVIDAMVSDDEKQLRDKFDTTPPELQFQVLRTLDDGRPLEVVLTIPTFSVNGTSCVHTAMYTVWYDNVHNDLAATLQLMLPGPDDTAEEKAEHESDYKFARDTYSYKCIGDGADGGVAIEHVQSPPLSARVRDDLYMSMDDDVGEPGVEPRYPTPDWSSFDGVIDDIVGEPVFYVQWSSDLHTLKISDRPLLVKDPAETPCWTALMNKKNAKKRPARNKRSQPPVTSLLSLLNGIEPMPNDALDGSSEQVPPDGTDNNDGGDGGDGGNDSAPAAEGNSRTILYVVVGVVCFLLLCNVFIYLQYSRIKREMLSPSRHTHQMITGAAVEMPQQSNPFRDSVSAAQSFS